MKTMEYLALCIPVKDGGLSVMFPDVKGCVSYGRDIEEAKRNAAEALALHAQGMAEDGDELPPPAFDGSGVQDGDIVARIRVAQPNVVREMMA